MMTFGRDDGSSRARVYEGAFGKRRDDDVRARARRSSIYVRRLIILSNVRGVPASLRTSRRRLVLARVEPHAVLEVPRLDLRHLVHLATVAEKRKRRREPHVRRGVRQGVDVREYEVRVRVRAAGVAKRGEHAGAVRAPRRAKLHNHQLAFR